MNLRLRHPVAMAVLTVMILLSLVTGCVRRSARIDDGSPVDPTFSISSFVEEGELVVLVVGTRPAWHRENRSYIPMEVAIVNKGLASLSLTPESFKLVDENNVQYPVVGRKELSRGYGSHDADRRLGEILPVLLGRYRGFTVVPSNFTPGFDRPLARKKLFLPRFSLAYDFLYFPRPETGVRGHYFELFMEAPELPDPVFVRFEVRR